MRWRLPQLLRHAVFKRQSKTSSTRPARHHQLRSWWPLALAIVSLYDYCRNSRIFRESDAKTVDYDSFTVQESASTSERKLKYLSFSEYLERQRGRHKSSTSSCLSLFTKRPTKNRFAPVPDVSPYTVRYYYYQTVSDMSQTIIRFRRFHVIVNRAKYYTTCSARMSSFHNLP